MNTDQAFDLLTDAGVTEDISIQTVRRWLKEKKIKYEGTVQQNSGYILDDSDEVFNMLKDAGVPDNIATKIVQRWLNEGKIQNVKAGKRKNQNQYIPNEKASLQRLNNPADQDRIIRQLQVKIKAQNEHIKGIEQLHETSINTLIQQRNKLNKEIISLEHENSELQRETQKLLKENFKLHKELTRLKDELTNGSKKDPDKTHAAPSTKMNNYRQKLGLSKNSSHKEVLAGYKKLLKATHPDQGGSPTAFHYIKTDYDDFRNSIKE
jgi:predicted site-specific integrase-resolvase